MPANTQPDMSVETEKSQLPSADTMISQATSQPSVPQTELVASAQPVLQPEIPPIPQNIEKVAVPDTFKLTSGQQKLGTFLVMINDTVFIEIKSETGEDKYYSFHKSKFNAIRLHTNTAVDLSASEFVPIEQAPIEQLPLIATKDTTKVPFESYSREVSDKKEEDLKGAGKYVRKSLLLVPNMLPMDASAYKLRPEHNGKMIMGYEQSINSYSRFEVDTISTYFYREFYDTLYDQARQAKNEKEFLGLIKSSLEKILAPKILGSISAVKEERAKNLLDEQQLNSFITDKAKLSGITSSELSLVLNSGYIILPALRKYVYGTSTKDGSYVAQLRMGMIIYRIRLDDKAGAQLQMVKSIYRNGMCSITPGAYDSLQQQLQKLSLPPLPPIERYVFDEANDMARNALAIDLVSIDDFRLTSQLMDVSKGRVTYPISRNEIGDVGVDNVFEFIDRQEMPDGTIKAKKHGWSVVEKVDAYKFPGLVTEMMAKIKPPTLSLSLPKGMSFPKNKKPKKEKASKKSTIDTTLQEYNVKAVNIAGAPSLGTLVKEYPRSPFDVNGQFILRKLSLTGIPATGDAYLIGPKATISGFAPGFELNIGTTKTLNISQLFTRFSLSFASLGNADTSSRIFTDNTLGTSQPIQDVSAVDIGFGVEKKFYFRRLAPKLFGDIAYSAYSVNGKDSADVTKNASLTKAYLGLNAGVGAEIAIIPDASLGVSFGAALPFIPIGKWTYRKNSDDEGSDVDGPYGTDGFNLKMAANLTINAWPLTKLFDLAITGIFKAVDKAKAMGLKSDEIQDLP